VERAALPSQVKLGRFLAQVDAIAGPVLAAVSGPVAAGLIVGFSDGACLIGGGLGLGGYLFPIAQRLGPQKRHPGQAVIPSLAGQIGGYGSAAGQRHGRWALSPVGRSWVSLVTWQGSWHRWVIAAASAAEAHVLARQMYQHALAGDADVVDRHP